MPGVGMDIPPTGKMGKQTAGYSGFVSGAVKEGQRRCSISLQTWTAFTHWSVLPSLKGDTPALS